MRRPQSYVPATSPASTPGLTTTAAVNWGNAASRRASVCPASNVGLAVDHHPGEAAACHCALEARQRPNCRPVLRRQLLLTAEDEGDVAVTELRQLIHGGFRCDHEIEVDEVDTIVLCAVTNEGEREAVLAEQVDTPIVQAHLHQDQPVDRPATHQIEQRAFGDRSGRELEGVTTARGRFRRSGEELELELGQSRVR